MIKLNKMLTIGLLGLSNISMSPAWIQDLQEAYTWAKDLEKNSNPDNDNPITKERIKEELTRLGLEPDLSYWGNLTKAKVAIIAEHIQPGLANDLRCYYASGSSSDEKILDKYNDFEHTKALFLKIDKARKERDADQSKAFYIKNLKLAGSIVTLAAIVGGIYYCYKQYYAKKFKNNIKSDNKSNETATENTQVVL